MYELKSEFWSFKFSKSEDLYRFVKAFKLDGIRLNENVDIKGFVSQVSYITLYLENEDGRFEVKRGKLLKNNIHSKHLPELIFLSELKEPKEVAKEVAKNESSSEEELVAEDKQDSSKEESEEKQEDPKPNKKQTKSKNKSKKK